MGTGDGKTLSSMFMGVVHYLNKRPVLSLLIVVTCLADFALLSYANSFESGLWTYFEYRPFEAGAIVSIAVALIFVLVKKVDR